MTKTDRPAFLRLMNMAGATLPFANLDAAKLDGYWFALEDLPIGDVTIGVKACLRECNAFPTPAEIRERATGGVKAAAADAWAEVLEQLKDCRNATYSSDTIRRVVGKMGGSLYLGTKVAPEDMHWRAKEFIELYAEEAKRDAREGPRQIDNTPAEVKRLAEGIGND